MRKITFAAFIAAILAAGLSAMALVNAPAPAVAAPKNASDCLTKFRSCNNRCFKRYTDYDEITRCIKRTCEKQHDRCLADLGLPLPGQGPLVQVPGNAPTGPFSTSIGTGILLQSGPGLATQGPSATGAPALPKVTPAPAPGPIIN